MSLSIIKTTTQNNRENKKQQNMKKEDKKEKIWKYGSITLGAAAVLGLGAVAVIQRKKINELRGVIGEQRNTIGSLQSELNRAWYHLGKKSVR